MHDPNVFEDPMEFRPERYLKNGQVDPDILDPEAVAFGSGQRQVLISRFPSLLKCSYYLVECAPGDISVGRV
jgi:hypothetical protein